MRSGIKKIFALLAFVILMAAQPLGVRASPWDEEQGYGNRVAGKFKFGLKNTLLSWGMIFVEPYEPQYDKEWVGLWVGVSKCVLCTATGMIQLVTFPIPVDFPDLGRCTGLPEKKTTAAAKTPDSTAASLSKDLGGKAAVISAPAVVPPPAGTVPPTAAALAKPVEPPAAPVSVPVPAEVAAAKKFIK